MKNKKELHKAGEANKSEPSLQFPRISRFIPDKFNEGYLFIAGLLFILISTAVVGIDLYQNLSLERKLTGETSELQKKLGFWESEVVRHPNFRDAYFNLALVNYQLRDFNSSKKYLEKVLEIDPNFKAGIKLQEILLSQ